MSDFDCMCNDPECADQTDLERAKRYRMEGQEAYRVASATLRVARLYFWSTAVGLVLLVLGVILG